MAEEREGAVVVVGEPTEGGGALAAGRALALQAPHSGRLLWVPAASGDDPALLEVGDDVLFREDGLATLPARVARCAAQARRERRAALRAAWLEGLLWVGRDLPAFSEPGDVFRRVGPRILGLPGVRGLLLLRLADGGREPAGLAGGLELGLPARPDDARIARALAEVRRVTVDHEGDRLEILPLGTVPQGVLVLRVAIESPVDPDVLESLGDALARAVASARLLGALKERQARLERGFIERQRRIARLTSRLERLGEARDSFISLLSHDLRSPLAVILGHCQLLEEGVLPEAHRTRAVETIRRQSDRMERMVEDLLDRSRRSPDSGGEAERADLGRLAREMVEIFAPVAARRRQRLVATSRAEAPVLGDLGSIREVIAILLENGLRNAPEGGTVSLGVSGGPEEVHLEVVDDGPPFPPNPFSADAVGKGRGLRACLRVLADNGGTMRTGASANGGGLLGLTLPRARSEASARHVLLVGSDLDRLDWLTELVGPAWDVSSTVLTAGGVPPVEGGAPAVVVLDGSPDPEAALIALRVLKDDSVMGAVPVILLAPPTGPTIELAHGLGALEVLPGPLDGDALLAALRRTASLVRRVEGSVAGRSLDPLTGLDTARALGVRLPGLVAACRAGGRPLPVVWVDVTDLRGFNLTHGWMQGDQLLLWIGGELRQRAGAGDLLARVGADGFALVMPGKNLGEASLISTGIREYLARTRPRLGVTRVAFQVRVDLVDFTQAGKQVEDRLSEIRAAGETEDVA